MNLPNKLTLLRIIAIPVIVVIYGLGCMDIIKGEIFLNVSIVNFVICILFVLASLTDFLDGYLARKNNQVTTFGKLMDPLADKLLVMTALLIFMDLGVIYFWVVLIILAREFIVTGIRLLAVEKGIVISAGKLGKLKTASTMVGLIVLFFYQINDYVLLTGSIIIYFALLITIISGIEYFIKSRKIIFESI